MSRQSELFRRAAECQRIVELTADRKKKLIFARLRDVWTVLANENSSLPIDEDIAAIEEIQLVFEEGVSGFTYQA